MADRIRAACFGAPGSHTDEAMRAWFGAQPVRAEYMDTFEDVVRAVAERRAERGIVPIENSSTGGITEVYDLIRVYDCAVTGEKCISIRHHLMARPGTRREEIRAVCSHPQGLAQCRSFLAAHREWERIPCLSTSESAARAAETPGLAAIAGSLAAEIYGLEILEEDIQENAMNCTRFFIIAPESVPDEKADKITLVLTVPHEPGALYHVLGCFFYGGMNMTHLESRPNGGAPFDYCFHIDVMGRLDDPANAQTLSRLASMCTGFRILGNYAADRTFPSMSGIERK